MNECPITEDRVKVLIADDMKDRDFVNKPYCDERHKGVTSLESKVKSMDVRLWGILALVLATLLSVVLKGH